MDLHIGCEGVVGKEEVLIILAVQLNVFASVT